MFMAVKYRVTLQPIHVQAHRTPGGKRQPCVNEDFAGLGCQRRFILGENAPSVSDGSTVEAGVTEQRQQSAELALTEGTLGTGSSGQQTV